MPGIIRPTSCSTRGPCSTRDMLTASVLVVAVSIVMLFLPAATSGQTTESPAAKIAREYLPAVLTLVALDAHDQPLALGSGFFITRNGIVATNAHVVEGAARVVVRWRGQTGAAERILRFDAKYDLITLQTSFSNSPAVALGDSELVTVGQDVIVLGSPQGLEGTVSTGILSGVRNLEGVKFLQITAPISPGSSGGPVFNTGGRVIGIATATVARGQNLNFALPINLLRDLGPSSIMFSGVKHVPPDPGSSQNLRELVFVNNISERAGMFYGALSSLTVSIQNKTPHTVGNFRILVVIKNPDGEILNFHLNELKYVVIPPGLAQQVSLTAQAEGYYDNRYEKSRKGSYEIRILDFKILTRGGGAVEELFKPR